MSRQTLEVSTNQSLLATARILFLALSVVDRSAFGYLWESIVLILVGEVLSIDVGESWLLK